MTIIQDLIQRRVPQILGIYLATSWAIIEFLDWLINRFSISPHLSAFGLTILASMIPTVLLLAYFHGKPGCDTWTKIEKIGIPTNVLAVIFLLFFLFKGKDLGAATTMITLENEEGQTIERIIPKSEFRKKIMIFFPENESGDTSLNWLSYGIADMLSTDLYQDFYLEAKTVGSGSGNEIEKIRDAGFSRMTGLPLLLEKDIAEDLHMDYFLTGSFTKQDDIYSINTKLYNTRNGKLIDQNVLTNHNVFDLVDQLSVQVKYDLEIPEYHLEDVDDLPVSEISTKSLTAYKWYITGMYEIICNKNWNKALNDLNQSVQEDSTFAIAYYGLYKLYFFANQSENGAWIFTPLMNHLYKMPEKLQLFVKADYFLFNDQISKSFAVLEMLSTLFPEDIESRLNLIEIYKIRNQYDEAIAEYKYILELDPERYSVYNDIGAIYHSTGKFDEALDYYTRYAEQFPDRPESYRSVGNLHKTKGDFEAAKSCYEKALLLEPENVSDLLILANIESETGNFNQALIQFQDAFDKSKTPEEKAQVYAHLQNFYELRGEMNKALEYLYLKQDEWEKFRTPFIVALNKIRSLDLIIKLEKEEVAFQILETCKAQLDEPFDRFVALGYLWAYLGIKDIDNVEKTIREVNSIIEEFKYEIWRSIVLDAYAQLNELKGQYEQAIQNYLDQLSIQPTASTIYTNIGRCYRMLKDYKKAEEALQKAMKAHPFSPDANYEMALVFYEMGKTEKALEHMKRTVSIWENADPDYEPALKAREKLGEWEE